MLPPSEQRRVHSLVRQFLSPEYDREFIATNIIYHAWTKGLEKVSRQYVRNKCSSAYHKRQRELKGNRDMIMMHKEENETENLVSGQVVGGEGMNVLGGVNTSLEALAEDVAARSELVEKLVLSLTPFERRLIYLRIWKSMTLEEVAIVMEISRETVQKALRVAMFKMNQELGTDERNEREV